MKYEYLDEKNIYANLCYITAGVIAILWTVAEISISGLKNINLNNIIIVYLAAIFIIFCGKKLNHEVLVKRQEHELFRQKGIKATGVVEKIIMSPNAKRTKEFYSFEVSYYSVAQGKQVTFTTPYVSFRPNMDDNITCTVYEYEGKQIADSFIGYTRQKRWDILKNIFIFASVVAIMVLVYKFILV